MTTLVASLAEVPSGAVLADLERSVDRVEVRADLLGDEAAAALLERFGEKVVYTLRSVGQGGRWEGDQNQRRTKLLEASRRGCCIDLELYHDDEREFFGSIPEAQRLWSWHGAFAGVQRLRERLAAMTALGGAWFKLVPHASTQADVMAVLEWLADQNQQVIAFAGGASAGWGRALASRAGAGWIYLSVGKPTAPGQFSLQRWLGDGYRQEIPTGRLFGVVGSPVQHSLSPRIHNAAYRALRLDCLYLPFEVPDFADFWLEVVESESWPNLGLSFDGMSVTAPHKRVALAVAGASSPLSTFVGAANTLVRERGVWEAETTDPEGVRLPLEHRGLRLQDVPAAVVGAGGAGRAAAVALQQAGSRVTLVNRSVERGSRTADRLKVPFVPLEEFEPARFQLVVHATSVGRADEEPPFAVESIRAGGWLVDMVYRHGDDGGIGEETDLVRRGRAHGLQVVDGREVLLAQARMQFSMMTGRDLPLEVAAEALALDPAIVGPPQG